MADYRLYFLDDKGLISGREDFHAQTDDEAVECAGVVLDACSDLSAGYELWSGVRRVAERNLATNRAPRLECLSRAGQARVVALEDTLQRSHWLIARSKRLSRLTEAALELGLAKRNLRSIDQLVAYAIERTGTDMVTIHIVEGNALKLVGSSGLDRAYLSFFDVVTAQDTCACGSAFASRRQILVSDTSTSPIFRGPALQAIKASGVRSEIATPIVGPDDKPLGMLALQRRTPWHPSSDELRDISALCADLARHMAK